MSLISKFGEVEFSHWCFHILPKVMSEKGLRQFPPPFHLGVSLYSWDNLPDLVCLLMLRGSRQITSPPLFTHAHPWEIPQWHGSVNRVVIEASGV